MSDNQSNAAPTAPSGPKIPPEIAANLPLVHRVLLADPSEWANMTISGGARMLTTPSFSEFETSLDESSDIAFTMKRAFRDQLCNHMMQQEQSHKPAQDLLLEFHQQLRLLIPSRTDLHGLLKDGKVQESQSIEELVSLMAQAARALSMLESEARADSTQHWINLVGGDAWQDREGSREQFVVSSLLYLLFKTELCAKDKQDFYFSHFWAKDLARIGPDIERAAFEAQHGSFTDPSTAPATRQWLSSLFDSGGDDASSSRQDRIKKSWVHDILFRAQNAEEMALPEVFYLDQMRLSSIRMIVRIAVAGSTLALHACQTAGQPTDVLAQTLEPSSPLDLRRGALVQAMGERGKSEDQYQSDVASAVVALAQHWNPDLESSQIESLRSRAGRVLAASDPVAGLLNDRMKACFTELLATPSASAPAEMRTGGATGMGTKTSRKLEFVTRATTLFCTKGLSFYASDLALAAWNALRVVEVAVMLYDTTLLEGHKRAVTRQGHTT